MTLHAGILPLDQFVAANAANGNTAARPCDDDESDMVILMLKPPDTRANGVAGNATPSTEFKAACEGLAWLDSLLRALDAVPGFKDTCLLTLVIGSGQGPLPVHSETRQATLKPSGEEQDEFPVQRPLQSFQFNGPNQVEVDEGRPAIVVHRLAGVIR